MNDDSLRNRSRRVSPRVLVSDRQHRPVDVDALAGLAERTLVAEGLDDVELSLSFVTSEEMADLHERYVGDPEPTDVLSFPMGEEGLLGDVVVCPDVAEGNNPDRDAELRLLVVHGVLHLLGYDHEDAEDRDLMWQRQEGYAGATP
jgi:probable rRNA maturation factor